MNGAKGQMRTLKRRPSSPMGDVTSFEELAKLLSDESDTDDSAPDSGTHPPPLSVPFFEKSKKNQEIIREVEKYRQNFENYLY